MRFIAFARHVRSALAFVSHRIPTAFTLAERLFVYSASYREAGDHSAGFDRVRLELVPLEARALLDGRPLANPVLFAAANGLVSEYAADIRARRGSVCRPRRRSVGRCGPRR